MTEGHHFHGNWKMRSQTLIFQPTTGPTTTTTTGGTTKRTRRTTTAIIEEAEEGDEDEQEEEEKEEEEEETCGKDRAGTKNVVVVAAAVVLVGVVVVAVVLVVDFYFFSSFRHILHCWRKSINPDAGRIQSVAHQSLLEKTTETVDLEETLKTQHTNHPQLKKGKDEIIELKAQFEYIFWIHIFIF